VAQLLHTHKVRCSTERANCSVDFNPWNCLLQRNAESKRSTRERPEQCGRLIIAYRVKMNVSRTKCIF
jgi:hypothetical protein